MQTHFFFILFVTRTGINPPRSSVYIAGRQLDGIWHTAIVAYGREYFFGPAGINSVRPVSILFHWQSHGPIISIGIRLIVR